MTIETSPLFSAAHQIINSGQTQTNFGWEAKVHLGNEILTPLMVLSVNTRRDYVGAFTDETTCTLLFPLGKYARRIYPQRNNLEVTLIKLPLLEVNAQIDTDSGIEAERYSAVLLDQTAAPTEAQGAEANDEDLLDLTQLIEVNFQLFNKAVEQLRTVAVGGPYRKTTVDQVILTLLTKEAMRIEVDEQRAIEGVDLVPVSNTEVKEQIVITHGTMLVDVLDYLQNRVGIYSSGLGHYIQHRHWYVYPLYDAGQYHDRTQTLTIIVLPLRKYSDIERTYTQVGGCLTVLATSQSGFKDDSKSQYLTDGNGARFADANKMMDSATTKDNRSVMARSANNSEFVTDKREDGLSHVPVTSQRITANPFTVYSNLNARNGGVFKCVWQNSDAKLLTPGMPTRILYNDEKETREIYGVLHLADSISHKTGDFGSRRFSNQTVLTVFVNRNIVE